MVNPNVKNPGAELRRLQKKKDGGAKYALSQPVLILMRRFPFSKKPLPLVFHYLLGFFPLKSAKSALSINSIPGIKLPEDLIAKVEKVSPEEGF